MYPKCDIFWKRVGQNYIDLSDICSVVVYHSGISTTVYYTNVLFYLIIFLK